MRYLIMTVRIVILLVMALFWLAAGTLICVLRPMHRNNVHALTTMLVWAQRVIGVKVICHFEPARIRENMPAVMVGLHQGDWDVITMAGIPQPGMVCVGKKSLIFTPIFGLLFVLSGNILIDRDNRNRAAETMLKVVERIKKRRLSVWMFPEGTRSGYGPVGRFKSGALHMAMLAQVPVIPFVTSTYSRQIDLGRLDNGEVHIKMLSVIEPSSLSRHDIARMTAELRDQMITAMRELDMEVRRPPGYRLPALR